MKLWISGEIEGPIDEAFRDARKKMEQTINAVIEDKTYGLPLDGWDCIAILRKDNNFEEITKYSKKKQDMDFRLKVDYDKFLSGTQLQREKLFFNMLERSLALLKEKGLPADGIDQLHLDLKRVAAENGWN